MRTIVTSAFPMPLALSSNADSVVSLKNNLLLLPAQLRKLVAIGGNHIIQPADIRMNIEPARLSRSHHGAGVVGAGAFDHYLCHMLLHVSAQPLPVFFRTAQG